MNFDERMNLLLVGGSIFISGALTVSASNKCCADLMKVKITKNNLKREIYNTLVTVGVLTAGIVTTAIGAKGIMKALTK